MVDWKVPLTQKQQMIDFRHKLGEHIQRKQNWPGAKAQKAHEDDADNEVTVSTHSDKHTFEVRKIAVKSMRKEGNLSLDTSKSSNDTSKSSQSHKQFNAPHFAALMPTMVADPPKEDMHRQLSQKARNLLLVTCHLIT